MVSISVEARISLPVQKSPEFHPAPYKIGTGFFLGYSDRSLLLTLSAPKMRTGWSYT
jgi:hypothetical protein